MQVKDDGTLKLTQGQQATLQKAKVLCLAQFKLTGSQRFDDAAGTLLSFAESNGPKPKSEP